MEPASDLLSKLPNHVLSFIISKLPIKEAVRSSILSRRWRYLYNEIPKLTLSPDLLMGMFMIPNPLAIAQVENMISNILLLHSSTLERFDLYTRGDWHFTSENICRWVHRVASKNVQDLSLRHLGPLHRREILPPSVFLCNRLSSLTLFDYIITNIPTGFGGFKHLTDCFFRNVKFRDESLALFLSHCPLLQELRLKSCIVPKNSTISSPHIEALTLHIPIDLEILSVNCPKLRKFICISNTNDLSLNGLLFKDVSCDFMELDMDSDGTVIEMSLKPNLHGTNTFSAERCAQITEKFKFLRSLEIDNLRWEDKMDIPTTKLLQGLPRLERLYISGVIDLVRIFLFCIIFYVGV